jgi:hypothetical protein
MSFTLERYYKPSLEAKLRPEEITILKKADQIANRRSFALVILVSCIAMPLLLGIGSDNTFHPIHLISYLSLGFLMLSLRDEGAIVDAKMILDSYQQYKSLKKMNAIDS